MRSINDVTTSGFACGCVRWFSRGTPIDWLVSMSEIILKGTLNCIKKTKTKKHQDDVSVQNIDNR